MSLPSIQQDTGGGNLLHSRPLCSRRLFLSRDRQTSEDGHQLNISLHSQSLSQVHSSTMRTSNRCVSPCSADTNSEGDLSVSVSSISASVTTPVEVLAAIWKKASELLHEHNSVVVAPGHSEHARMVKSYSGL